MGQQQVALAFPPASASFEDRLMTIEDVMKMTTLSKSEIYRRHESNAFPARVQLGPRAVAYRLSDIQRWMRDLPAVPDAPVSKPAEPEVAQTTEAEPPPPPKKRRSG